MRALAATGVVVAHAWGGTGHSPFGPFQERLVAGAGFGGLFFFALSGCLLYMPFVRRDFAGGSISLRNYALNRVVRIFPLYYVALIVVFALQEGGGSFDQWWRFALFAENFDSSTLYQVIGPLWTVVIEFHFFLLLPFIAWGIAAIARGSVRRAMLVVAAIALASLTLRIVTFLANPTDYDPLLRYSFPSTFYLIAAGMLVPLVRQAWSERRPAWLRGPLASRDAWLVAAVLPWTVFVWNYQLEPVFAIACFLTLGALVLPLDEGRLLRILDWRPLAVVGLASYSIYVWHVPLMTLVTDRGTNTLAESFPLLIAVLLPLSYLVGMVSFKLVEEPALRLRRRWGSAQRASADSRLGGWRRRAEASSLSPDVKAP